MKILAIDTSSLVASAAVMDEDKLIAEYIINHKKTHSEQLMPIIEEILESCEIDIEEIDAVGVASGPGSFTGLRIGGAAAKGLAHALNKPVIGVPTLNGLAFNLPFCEGLICPIMDARRHQVYTALYKWEEGNFYQISDHRAVGIEELTKELKDREEMIVFLGDGVPVHRDIIVKELGPRARFAPRSADRQRASSIGELAFKMLENNKGQNYGEFTPFYLRKSQAEREYDKKRGIEE